MEGVTKRVPYDDVSLRPACSWTQGVIVYVVVCEVDEYYMASWGIKKMGNNALSTGSSSSSYDHSLETFFDHCAHCAYSSSQTFASASSFRGGFSYE